MLAHAWMLPCLDYFELIFGVRPSFGCQILTEEKAERPCSECSERSRSQKRVEAQPRHEKGETELYADLVGLELVPAISCCFTWDGWPPTPFASVFSVTIHLKIKGLLRHQWTNQKLIGTFYVNSHSSTSIRPRHPSNVGLRVLNGDPPTTRLAHWAIGSCVQLQSKVNEKKTQKEGRRSHATTHTSKISRKKFHEISWNLNNT